MRLFRFFVSASLVASLCFSLPASAQNDTDLHYEATKLLLDYLDKSDDTIQAIRQDRVINDKGIEYAESGNDFSVTGSASGTLSYRETRTKVGPGVRTSEYNNDQDLATSLSLSKTLFDWGRQESNIRQAQLIREGSEHTIRLQTESAYGLALRAYYDVMRSIARVNLREKSLVNLRSKVLESKQRLEVGIDNSTTLAVAKAGLALGESLFNQEQSLYSSAISDLKNYAPEGFERYLPKKVNFPKPHEKLQQIPLEDALRHQQELSSSLALTLHAISLAEAQLVILEKADRPNVDLSMNLARQHEYGDTLSRKNSASAVVTLTAPLISKGTVGVDVARQKQRIHKARLEHRANLDRQQLLLKQAWNEFHAFNSTILAAEKNVAARTALLDRAKYAQQVGQFTTPQVLDEEDRLLDAQLQLIDNEHQQLLKGFEIILLIGWPLRENL